MGGISLSSLWQDQAGTLRACVRVGAGGREQRASEFANSSHICGTVRMGECACGCVCVSYKPLFWCTGPLLVLSFLVLKICTVRARRASIGSFVGGCMSCRMGSSRTSNSVMPSGSHKRQVSSARDRWAKNTQDGPDQVFPKRPERFGDSLAIPRSELGGEKRVRSSVVSSPSSLSIYFYFLLMRWPTRRK